MIGLRLLAAAGSMMVAGCQTAAREPLPYSPNYSYRSTEAVATTVKSGVVRKGYDKPPSERAETAALVPDACATPDVTEQALYLPPGCANNLNLQMMVERRSDLLHGRRTGPAMAEPVARAARRVIDGEPPPLPPPDTRYGLQTTELSN